MMRLPTLRWKWAMLVWLIWVVGGSRQPPLAAQERQLGRHIVVAGTDQETEYLTQTASKPGPCVVVVGGVHGNEPAGAEAARAISEWVIKRGKLIVVPEANVLALAANQRYTPGTSNRLRDLNRNFPRRGDEPDEVRGDLAAAHWELVRQLEPDWVVDLHEGFDFHQVNDRSVGSTIIVYPRSRSLTATSMMIESVNALVEEPEKKFIPLVRGPVDGSLARAAAEHLGTESLILETTVKDQSLETRVLQHQVMVDRLLRHLRMIDPHPREALMAAARAAGRLAAARQPSEVYR